MPTSSNLAAMVKLSDFLISLLSMLFKSVAGEREKKDTRLIQTSPFDTTHDETRRGLVHYSHASHRAIQRERATFEVHVAQVEEGCQELEDLPALAVCEGEDPQGGAHTGIVFGVVTPLTDNTVTLQKRYQRLQSSS